MAWFGRSTEESFPRELRGWSRRRREWDSEVVDGRKEASLAMTASFGVHSRPVRAPGSAGFPPPNPHLSSPSCSRFVSHDQPSRREYPPPYHPPVFAALVCSSPGLDSISRPVRLPRHPAPLRLLLRHDRSHSPHCMSERASLGVGVRMHPLTASRSPRLRPTTPSRSSSPSVRSHPSLSCTNKYLVLIIVSFLA